MPSVQVEANLSHNKLLEAVGQFSQVELEQFVEEVIVLRAKRQVPSLPRRESELLLKINQQLPARAQARFDKLAAKRRDEVLTSEEHEELLRLIEQVEVNDVIRIEALAQLAELRGLSLDELMSQLGIQTP